ALMSGPIQEAIAGSRDPSSAYESLMSDVALALSLPRRMKERIRNIVAAQPRLRAGKLGTLPRREHFEDAATLFAIDCEARGERRPEWLDAGPDLAMVEEAPTRRRRRRRR